MSEATVVAARRALPVVGVLAAIGVVAWLAVRSRPDPLVVSESADAPLGGAADGAERVGPGESQAPRTAGAIGGVDAPPHGVGHPTASAGRATVAPGTVPREVGVAPGSGRSEPSPSADLAARLAPSAPSLAATGRVRAPEAVASPVEEATPAVDRRAPVAARRLEGEVVEAPDGRQPLAEVTVAIYAWEGPPPSSVPPATLRGAKPVRTVRTDANGRFAFQGVDDGVWVLSASAAPGRLPRVVVAKVRDRSRRVRIAEPAGVRYTFVDEDGAPVPWTHVSLAVPPSAKRGIEATANEYGEAELEGVEAGALGRLTAEASGEFLPMKPVETKIHDETYTIPRAYRVVGTVKDPRGRPRWAKALWAKWEGVEWTPVELTDDRTGAFTIGRVPKGPVQLKVHAAESHAFDPDAPTVEVPAGSENVVLSTYPGIELDVVVADWLRAWGGANAMWKEHGAPMDLRRVSSVEDVSAEGRLHVRGLRKEVAYDLWIAGLPGDRVVFAPGLRGDRDLVVVRTSPRVGLSGRIEGVPAGHQVAIRASMEGWEFDTQPGPDGRFEFHALPEATWKLFARTVPRGAARQVLEARSEASTGAEATLRLEPPPDPPRR